MASGGMVLERASKEWSSRPQDEKFGSLEDLHAAVVQRMARTATARAAWDALHVRPAEDGGALVLNGKTSAAELTHYSFGQLAARVGAPAGYLRGLPLDVAAAAINHGLEKRGGGDGDGEGSGFAQLLLDVGGGEGGKIPAVRALTTDTYSRIWDKDVTRRLLELHAQSPEWQPAPATFDGSRGLYAGDRNVFAFMVDNERRIFEKGPGGGLGRGFFVWNSEVGDCAFGVCTFLYEYVCGNHRVWGAKGVKELRVRHVGRADERAWSGLAGELKVYAEGSANEDEAKVQAAMRLELGSDKDAVLDAVFGLRGNDLARKRIAEGYDLAEQRVDWYGNPRSAWGLAGGLTELARDLPNADERVKVERGAGRVMAMAWA